jgi:hypothetical protein
MQIIKGLILVLATFFILSSCERHKSPKQNAVEGIDNVKESVSNAAKEAKDKTEKATKDIGDGIEKTTDKVKKDLD